MFPAPEQSLMICGIDEWSRDSCPVIAEPRLARSLGVAELRGPSAGRKYGDVPVIRFPRFYFCPECRRLDRANRFDTVSKKSPYCSSCGRLGVPSRFVIACKSGHIDDFPYSRWVHGGTPTTGTNHQLTLDTRGETSALSDIEVRCSCGARRTMDGSFGPKAMLGITPCHGNRPWLPGSAGEQCSEIPRTLQRGSSSTWFANVRSAISIPPWSEVHKLIAASWAMLAPLPDEVLRDVFAAQPGWFAKHPHLTVDRLVAIVNDMRSGGPPDEEGLRKQEYEALIAGHPEHDPGDQFVCLPVSMTDPKVSEYIAQVREVSRLREVTALVSFSRLVPTGPTDPHAAQLSQMPTDWLPAMEVFGEGIFVGLDPDRLKAWAAKPFVRERTGKIFSAAATVTLPPTVDAVGLLIHSFAHALMNELSLDAGYPVASLRERIYAVGEQAGVLIYTATADSAGSLGGLSAQSEPARLANVIRSAMRRALWCTSDPVCLESTGSGIGNLNLAACHACMLVPETSCEQRNTLLDRALLIGTPDEPDAGFFSELTQT
ncbi:MAG: DrmB family protein [Propionibacteriaceae bacterium]